MAVEANTLFPSVGALPAKMAGTMLLQSLNASFPMLVTPEGIVTLVREMQLENAEIPMQLLLMCLPRNGIGDLNMKMAQAQMFSSCPRIDRCCSVCNLPM